MRNYTQTEIADKMRSAQSTIARLEQGDHDPRFSTIQAYATALGGTLEFWIVIGDTAYRIDLT